MYDHFDDFIKTFGGENASEDYWYDVALFESIETVNKFNEDDWEKVMQNISSKSKIWKIRLLESFGDDSSAERIIITHNLLEESSDDEVLMAAIDYLRGIPIRLSGVINGKSLQKLKSLKEKNKINKIIIDDFMKSRQEI
jgi:lin0188 protein